MDEYIEELLQAEEDLVRNFNEARNREKTWKVAASILAILVAVLGLRLKNSRG